MTDLAAALRITADALFSGAQLICTDRLTELGLWELLAEDAETAVTVLLEAQGRHLGRSRLVEHCALEGPTDSPVALPIGGGRGALLADIADAANGARLTPGIDPAAGWAIVEAASPLTPRQTALARRAISHELVGVASAMLEMAVNHVNARHQFGVPIGSFQAVQHRLADVLVAIESTRAVLRVAWIDDDPWTCWAARRTASDAFEIAAANCGQVLGAMGFTWEHPYHRYVRRGLLLSILEASPGVPDASPPAPLAEMFS